MVAVQGPAAEDLVAGATDDAGRVTDLAWFDGAYLGIGGVECWVARTGYTGEDGFEVICPVADAEAVWSAFDCQPCGLGARDTLRLEAGLLLSGQDFDPEDDPRTPLEVGIDFAVDLETEFVGRDALVRQREAGLEERLQGLVMVDRGVARHGYEVRDVDGTTVGTVTSGTMSPTLGKAIAMGYLPVEYEPGDEVRVVVRGESKKAKVVTKPFLDE